MSITAVYDKLQGLETAVSAALVQDSAQQLAPILQHLRAQVPPLLKGYRLRILDGNHLPGTQHRIEELRHLRAAGLPGLSLVVLDPQLMLITNVIPCEDGHAQERTLIQEVLPHVQPADLWLADSNFCTSRFVFEVAGGGAHLLVRQHAGTLRWQLLGKRKACGRIETGKVYEQAVRLEHPQTGEVLVVRRITLELDTPTRDGDTEIHLLTNLPARDASAKQVARLYARRWTIEQAFEDLAVALVSEIHTLGYPRAALFGFCLALVAYNAVSLVKASLRAVHGHQTVEEQVSWYYLCLQLSKVYAGMMIAIPAQHWEIFRQMDDKELAATLKAMARKIDLRRFRKHPRGPKKPRPYRLRSARHKHVSTARLLAARSP